MQIGMGTRRSVIGQGQHRALKGRALQALQHGDELGISHEELGLPVIQDVLHLGACQPPVHGHADRANLLGSERQDGALGLMVGEGRHTIAPCQALGLQALRDLVGEALHLRKGPVLARCGPGDARGLVASLLARHVNRGALHGGLLWDAVRAATAFCGSKVALFRCIVGLFN